MSVTIKILDASFPNKLFVVGFPYIKLATNAFLFGTNEEKSLKNIAPNGTGNATKYGNPIYGDGFATLSPENYIGTSRPIAYKPITMIGVVRTDAQYAQYSMGTYRNNTKRGFMLYNNTNTLSVFIGDGTNAFDKAGVPFTAKTPSFKFVAMTFDGANIKTYGFDSTGVKTAIATGVSSATTETCYFGGMPDIGPFDIAFGATYDTVLTDSQINEIYQYTKSFLATRNVTVV